MTCFLPIHVYDTEHSRPVAVILRPGKTPSGREVRAHLRRLVRRIRRRRPDTRITFRGDSHYAGLEAMTFCEQDGVDYIFALAGTKPLESSTRSVMQFKPNVRSRTRSWSAATPRPATRPAPGIVSAASARVEATQQGLDVRYVVTSLDIGSAEWIYDSPYCARGQAENLIKLHKTQLASDRTS
ncbi:hypothetical protein ACVIGB_008805 [Bradyrhizobium sp. USDA 4341]